MHRDGLKAKSEAFTLSSLPCPSFFCWLCHLLQMSTTSAPPNAEDALDFCQRMCAQSQRGSSHNADHMARVWDIANELLEDNLANPTASTVKLSSAGAFLLRLLCLTHDLCDHKYDHDSKIRSAYDAWLGKLGYSPSDVLQIHRVLVYAGYSAEGKQRNGASCVDWVGILASPIGHVSAAEVRYVRQLLSEADKLDALGLGGIERCQQYIVEVEPSLEDNRDELHRLVVQHYHDKLGRLPEFFETERGVQQAQQSRDEMATALGIL